MCLQLLKGLGGRANVSYFILTDKHHFRVWEQSRSEQAKKKRTIAEQRALWSCRPTQCSYCSSRTTADLERKEKEREKTPGLSNHCDPDSCCTFLQVSGLLLCEMRPPLSHLLGLYERRNWNNLRERPVRQTSMLPHYEKVFTLTLVVVR